MNTGFKTKLLFLGCAASALLACGKQQDPLKDSKYESIRHAQPLQVRKTPEQSAMVNVFQVECVDSATNAPCDFNFVQGVERKVQFRVRLNFVGSDPVNYSLVLLNQNELKALGDLSFVRDGTSNNWILSLHPNNSVVGESENSRSFDLNLKFVLSDKNTRSVLSQFAGADGLITDSFGRPLQMSVQKSVEQPTVEAIKISPALKLNPDQKAKIQFTVVTHGMRSKEDLYPNLIPGPGAPTNELVKVNALVGTGYSQVRLLQAAQKNKDGQQSYVYEIDFDARPFTDYVVKRIYENPVLKAKYEKGELTSAEAELSVEAINKYTGMKSPAKAIQFEVNLLDKPGKVILVGDSQFNLRIGAEVQLPFYMRTSDSRGRLEIEEVDVFGQIAKWQGQKVSAQKDQIQVEVSCEKGNPSLNEHFECKSGDCYKFCRLSVVTPCDVPAQKIAVNFSTRSQLRNLEEKSKINLTLNLSQKSALCSGAKK